MNRFIIPLAVLAACDDTTTTESDTGTLDTDTDTECIPFVGDTTVDTIVVDCDDVTDSATISAVLTGLSAVGTAKVFMQETGNIEPQWSEEHTLDSTYADLTCLASEDLAVTIPDLGVSTDAWADGVASVFTCGGHLSDNQVMTTAVYVEDIDDPTITSCFVIGHDPAGLIAGNYVNAGVDASFPLSGCGT